MHKWNHYNCFRDQIVLSSGSLIGNKKCYEISAAETSTKDANHLLWHSRHAVCGGEIKLRRLPTIQRGANALLFCCLSLFYHVFTSLLTMSLFQPLTSLCFLHYCSRCWFFINILNLPFLRNNRRCQFFWYFGLVTMSSASFCLMFCFSFKCVILPTLSGIFKCFKKNVRRRHVPLDHVRLYCVLTF